VSGVHAASSGKRDHTAAELMPPAAELLAGGQRALLGMDLSSKLANTVSGVHAAISGKRDHVADFLAPAAELLPAQRALLNMDLSSKLVAKVSGVHAAISGKRQAHDELMQVVAVPPMAEPL
jgi:hypothetical protein